MEVSRQSLLELIPAEIRLKIYRELLLSPDVIDIDWKIPKLHPNIMRTCKAIFRESHPVLYNENTFQVRVGIPRELRTTTPIIPPVYGLWDDTYRWDEKAACRRFIDGSYLHDVFPAFLPYACGLSRNKAFCGMLRQPYHYEKEKIPCRLVVTIECGDMNKYTIRTELDALAQCLGNMPLIHSLAILCENTAPGFWTTSFGISLGEMLCTYIGGSGIRHINTVTACNIPKEYANILIHEVKSAKPTSNLLLMWRAFKKYYLQAMSAQRTFGTDSHFDQVRCVMEKGDRKAFLYHREQAMRSISGITVPWWPEPESIYQYDAEHAPEHDPDEISQTPGLGN